MAGSDEGEGEVGGNGIKTQKNRTKTHVHLSRGLFDNIGRKRIHDKENGPYFSSVIANAEYGKSGMPIRLVAETYLILLERMPNPMILLD